METIVNYLFYLNIITLVYCLFFNESTTVLIVIVIINLVSLGLYKIMKKYEPMFNLVMETNKLARKIDFLAGKING
jgi:hypothetical protein